LPDIQGVTPLMRACGLDRVDIVEDLLKAGADLKITDHDGLTSLDYAKRNSSLGVLQLVGQTKAEDNELGD
jgi:ankyrin repeat protein